MKSKYSVILVDDHKLFREGLAFVISQMDEFEVVGQASNGEAFLEMIEKITADIVLMDVNMPVLDGITATTKALAKFPDLKIIALTLFCEEEYYFKMIQAGVSGYICKEVGEEELAKALRTVVTGENFVPQKYLEKIKTNFNNYNSNITGTKNKQIILSERESEVLNLVCQGLQSAEISEKTSLSIKSVKYLISGLIDKTGVKNSLCLILFALKHNLIN